MGKWASMSFLRAKFGQRLRQIRKQRDLTQEQLAESIQVSVEFISNMERGINAPSFQTLEKLSRSLNVNVMEFFRFENQGNT
jgi:transcriptional regulator with XRE-family HTH domain